VEVATGERRLEPSSGWPGGASEAPLDAQGAGFRSTLRGWAKRARRYVERQGLSLRLALLGVVFGAIVTWVATLKSDETRAPAGASQLDAPKERGDTNTSPSTKTEPASQASETVPSANSEAPPLSAEALPLAPTKPSAAPRASTTAKKASPPSPARKKKSIHDFGF
jgi:cell division protein FtsN